MKSLCLRYALTGLVLVAATAVFSGDAAAQCATCAVPTAVPTVAYQPVTYQPTVAYQPYTGWYPGKWLDRWRLRRAARQVSAAPVGAAPVYTAAFAPSAAPCNTCAVPSTYVTSYAPLAAPCSTCTQTVARPVLLRPVIAPACNTCSFTPACSCGTCDSCCSTGVSQAAYTEPACSSCGVGSTVTSAPARSYGQNVGPQTPQPTLEPEPAPQGSTYRSNRPAEGSGSKGVVPAASEVDDVDPLEKFDPGPAAEEDSSTLYNAPQLLDPSDRTALRHSSRKPTVDVWTAVYRKPVAAKSAVTQTSARSVRTQAEIDADGWAPVSYDR